MEGKLSHLEMTGATWGKLESGRESTRFLAGVGEASGFLDMQQTKELGESSASGERSWCHPGVFVKSAQTHENGGDALRSCCNERQRVKEERAGQIESG